MAVRITLPPQCLSAGLDQSKWFLSECSQREAVAQEKAGCEGQRDRCARGQGIEMLPLLPHNTVQESFMMTSVDQPPKKVHPHHYITYCDGWLVGH